MRKQDQLSAYIHSMSKNEKRFFKLQASVQGSDKTFIRLFDEMARAKTYEPELLAKKLNVSKRLLAYSKNYLEKILAQSLLLYNHENPGVWVSNQYRAANLLFKRKQYELALSFVEKGLAKAFYYDMCDIIISCLGLKFNILQALSKVKESFVIREQYNEWIRQWNMELEITNINLGFNRLMTGAVKNGPEFEKIEQREIFTVSEDKLISPSVKIFWHEMKHYFYYYVKHDLKKSIFHNRGKLAVYEKHPQLLGALPHSYFSALLYTGSLNNELGNYKEALKYATKMEYVATHKNKENIPVHLREYNTHTARILQLMALCYDGKFDAAVKKISQLRKDMDKIQSYHQIIIRYYTALAFFNCGRYDEALEACNELNSGEKGLLPEYLFYGKVLLVMIHYNMKNYKVLPHFVTAAASWTKRHQFDNAGSKELLVWLKKISQFPVSGHRQFFIEFGKATKQNVFTDYTRTLALLKWASDNLNEQK